MRVARLVIVTVAVASLLASSPLAQEANQEAAEVAKEFRLRGRLKEEFAYRLHDPSDVSKIRTIGWLEGKYTFSEAVNLRFEGRAWWDGVFEATSRYPPEVERDQKTDLSLRQALLSVSGDRLDVYLGRQQIVWGEAIGTFITDVVNPRDFREFILPDFTELRIPLWALSFTYRLAEGLNVEAVWTPDVRFHKIGKPGSEFEFRGPQFQFRYPVVRWPDDSGEFSLDRSEGGFRLSYLVSGWDLSLIYYNGHDKFAVLHQRRVAPPAGPEIIVLEPRHNRIHIIGGTLAKGIEPAVIRAEAAFTLGKRYETTDPLDPDGVVRRDTLDYLIGVDYTFARRIDTGLQFSQKVLAGPANNLTRGAIEAQVTSSIALRATTGFLDNTLNPTLLLVINVNRADYRLSPKLEYLATDSLTLTFGADIFGGPMDTLYGQFHSNDRVYVELSWRF